MIVLDYPALFFSGLHPDGAVFAIKLIYSGLTHIQTNFTLCCLLKQLPSPSGISFTTFVNKPQSEMSNFFVFVDLSINIRTVLMAWWPDSI